VYIELHCHSAFSFLDGASLPEQLALTASQLGYPALALTDHNGLYGSMAFAQESKQLGLQAITGAELTLLDGAHVTLLAETAEGYANLCRLITEAHLGRKDRHDPRLDFASLEARHAGLIILSGCRSGLLPVVLQRDGRTAARPSRWTASRRSGCSPKSCGSSSTTGSAGSSSSITICSTSPARSPPTCGAARGGRRAACCPVVAAARRSLPSYATCSASRTSI